MDYGTKSWEFSNIEASEDIKRFTVTGLYPVIIKSAEYVAPNVEGMFANSFSITIVGIDGAGADAEATLRYWMTDSKTGRDNWRSRNTLVGLGKALFGPDFKGIPHPDDMIGRVCLAEVTVKPTDDGTVAYPKVYHFTDIDDYYEIFTVKPQWFRPRRTSADL